MIFLKTSFIIMATCTCFPAVFNTRAAALNINNNYLDEPAPAEAITAYDMHETMYVHLKAVNSRNISPASQPDNCSHHGITTSTVATHKEHITISNSIQQLSALTFITANVATSIQMTSTSPAAVAFRTPDDFRVHNEFL